MEDTRFIEYYDEFQDALKNFAYKFTRDSLEAEELVQETFMRAYKAKDRFQEGTSFKSWSFTILRNLYISKYNKRKRRQTISKPVDEVAYAYDQNYHTVNKALNNINVDEIQGCIDELSYKSKMPFLMHVEGYQYDEIAQTLNIPIGTVKSRINFARTKLKKAIVSKGLYAA